MADIMGTLGAVDPRIRTIVAEVLRAVNADGHDITQNGLGIWYLWGKDGNPDNGEHYSGRGVDFMVRDNSDGDAVCDYLWANRVRFGLTHFIWRQRIKGTLPQFSSFERWAGMEDRGSTTENHMDHVHAYFTQNINLSLPPVGGPAAPAQEEDMPLTDADVSRIAKAVTASLTNDANFKSAVAGTVWSATYGTPKDTTSTRLARAVAASEAAAVKLNALEIFTKTGGVDTKVLTDAVETAFAKVQGSLSFAKGSGA